jgi:CheY-like chemotaxis protein
MSNERILVVEDEEEVVRFVEKILHGLGLRVPRKSFNSNHIG